MLLGEYEHTIDDKNRLTLPAKFRKSFAGGLVLTRGIDVNALVGREFTIGDVRCRGMRLCEPCTVVQRYASRPVLRPLVHRGGLRADILEGVFDRAEG